MSGSSGFTPPNQFALNPQAAAAREFIRSDAALPMASTNQFALNPDAAAARQFIRSDAALGHAPQTATGQRPDGEVTVEIAALSIGGWTDVQISGAMERMPASFELGLTTRVFDPTEPGIPDLLKPGMPCRILIGGDVVITGYLNRVVRSVSPNGHFVKLQGRSRCQDLVDCSAMYPNMSINGASVGDLAATLLARYPGLELKMPDGDGDGKAYQFSVSLGQTPYELISQVASYEGLIVHDDAAGDLVICRVGKTRFASGFTQGVNLEAFTAQLTDDNVFSTYVPVLNSTDALKDIGPHGNDAGSPVKDPGVERNRDLIVQSNQMVGAEFLAQKRAVWEATRRRGRSVEVEVVCDSWRDSAGRLWTHNVLAPVHIPSCNMHQRVLLLTEWTFERDANGTRAKIKLMPPEAFSVEPSAINGVNFMIAQAVQQRIFTDQNPGAGPATTAPNAGGANIRAGEGYGL